MATMMVEFFERLSLCNREAACPVNAVTSASVGTTGPALDHCYNATI
jgi:hypothetical protein